MKGFTLIEVMVSAAILLILIFALFSVMNISRSAWFGGDVSAELRQEIIKSFARMESELKETRPSQISLSSGATNASLTFKLPQDNNGDGTILDSLGNIEWSANITYALNSNHEITRTFGNQTAIISRNINSLLFSRPTSPNNILLINIAAQKLSGIGRLTQDSGEITIKMRN